MTKKTILLVLALLFLSSTAYVVGKYSGVIDPAQSLPNTSAISDSMPANVTEQKWKLESVATGLNVPWSMVFPSDSRIIVTQRDGNVRVIENGKLRPTPLHTFSQVQTYQEEGLMGMTLDPGYEQNSYIYFVYAYPTGSAYTDKIVRVKDTGTALTDETVLLDGIPAAKFHAGSRIKFGPDGKLYVTTGDATNKNNPQNKNSLGGKILRMNADGSIPEDNPFGKSLVWSYGHRNPQGIAWDPVSKTMYETEHGPSGIDGPLGGDEVNIISKASNYGWPIVSHKNHANGLLDPLLVFTPAIAPAGALYYTGDVYPQWKNHLLFAMLKGEGIMNVTFEPTDPTKVASFAPIAGLNVGRVRDIEVDSHGFIYFTTSNGDGRGKPKSGDDQLYKIVPAT